MRQIRIFLALGLSLLTFFAAQSVKAAELSSISSSPTSKLKVGGTLFLPISHEPSQFNPFHVDGNDYEINRMMSASLPSLFNSDAQGKLSINKNFVTSFTQTKTSPQTLRIVLNPKAAWSDGKKLSLTDFTGMWRALSNKNPNFEIVSSAGYENIKSVSSGKNINEIIVVMTKPYADWQELFSPLLPSSLTKDPGTFNGSWRAKPLSSAGAFLFESINREQGSISWVRNPRWWANKPVLENITFRILPVENQLAALKNEEISYVDVTDDASIIRQARGNPKFVIHAVASSEKWEQISINSKNPILSDLLVRQSISLALNRETFAEVNTGLFVGTPIPKNNRIFNIGQNCYKDNSGSWGKQSISRADQLLEQAGWIAATNNVERDSAGKNKVVGMRYYGGPTKPGLIPNQLLTLKYIYPAGNSVRENIAILTQAMLRAKPIGIDLHLIEVPAADFTTKFVNPDSLGFDLTSFSWNSSVLPISGAMNLYAKSSSQNFSKDSIPLSLDTIIKKARTEIDPTKRCTLANQVDAQLWENAYNIPLYNLPAASVTVKELANFGSFGLATIDWTKVGFTK